MPGRDLEIRCPDCGSRIRLDPTTGTILGHGPGERLKDLGEAAQRQAAKATDRDDAFRQALAAERDRKKELDDLFKKATESGSVGVFSNTTEPDTGASKINPTEPDSVLRVVLDDHADLEVEG